MGLMTTNELMTDDAYNFSRCLCMSELHLWIAGINMFLQIVAIKRYSVTGSVKGRRDACEDLAWTQAHEKDWGVVEYERQWGVICMWAFSIGRMQTWNHTPMSIYSLPQGFPLPLSPFSLLGLYSYSSEWDLPLFIPCFFLYLVSEWQLFVS